MSRKDSSSPVMIRAVLRAIGLSLLLPALCFGQAGSDAATALANRISSRLPANAAPRITIRNLSSASDAEAASIRAALEKALRRALPRGAPSVDVALTISQNVREFLLIAEFQENGEAAVEIAGYRPDPVGKSLRPVLEKRLLWEQPNIILDAKVAGDRLFVLEPGRLSAYGRTGSGTWQLIESKPLDDAPAIRDLRGKLEISNGTIAAIVPDRVCRGVYAPVLDLHCESGNGTFPVAGEVAHFTPGRNTIEAAGLPPFFSLARIADNSGALLLAAEADGRTRLYDASRRPVGSIGGWGSDLVSPEAGCASGRMVLVTAASDDEAENSITPYALADGKPSQAGERAGFPGAVTALWAEQDGATAVVHNLKTGTYAAYFVNVDCGS